MPLSDLNGPYCVNRGQTSYNRNNEALSPAIELTTFLSSRQVAAIDPGSCRPFAATVALSTYLPPGDRRAPTHKRIEHVGAADLVTGLGRDRKGFGLFQATGLRAANLLQALTGVFVYSIGQCNACILCALDCARLSQFFKAPRKPSAAAGRLSNVSLSRYRTPSILSEIFTRYATSLFLRLRAAVVPM
jgi:hypothetical protein